VFTAAVACINNSFHYAASRTKLLSYHS